MNKGWLTAQHAQEACGSGDRDVGCCDTMLENQPEAQDQLAPAVALDKDAGSSLCRDGKAVNQVLAAQHNSHASPRKTGAHKAESAVTAAPAAARAGMTSSSEPAVQGSSTAGCADVITQQNRSATDSNGKRGLYRNDQLGEGDQQQRVGLGSFAEMRIALPEGLPRLASGPAGEALNSNGSGNSSTSPSQQRPRGWQAMLCPSPHLDQDGSLTEHVELFEGASTTGNPSRRLPPPLISYGSVGDTSLGGTQLGPSARDGLSEPAPATEPATTLNNSKAGRPARLMVPAMQSNISSPDPRCGIADLPDNSFQPGAAPAQAGASGGAGGCAGGAGPDGNSLTAASSGAQQHRRMTVLIPSCEPPLSPLPQTPSSAQPYSGPAVYADELDLEAIDGVSVESLGVSASSSPSTTAPGSAASGSSFGGRSSAGLRTSRDHDLRRAALMNHMLSPRLNAPMSVSDSAAMFTGSCSRPRGSGGQQQAGEAGEASAQDAVAEGTGTTGSTSNEEALQLVQVLRLSRGPSPSLTSSPVIGGPGSTPGSILGSVRSRSLPGTPAGVAPAAPAPGSSRGTSMGSSPLAPPPSQGGAAALLAGSVLASPRTPRSPLSIVFSPRSGQRSVGHTPSAPGVLPPPLFHTSGGCISNSSNALGSTDSPVTTGLGSAGVPPTGRHTGLLSTRGSLLSPAGRFHATSPSPPPPAAAAAAVAAAAAAAIPADTMGSAAHAHQDQGEQQQHMRHQEPPQAAYQQLLRHTLQLHDTRFGPHGESPLSPSHHASLMHVQPRGETLLSPTRPTSLVPPSLMAMPSSEVDASALSATAAPQQQAHARPAFAGVRNDVDRDMQPVDGSYAAAARLVGDVGRENFHEWLDQHSWRYQYQLPHNLRNVELREMARASSARQMAGALSAGVLQNCHPRGSYSEPGSRSSSNMPPSRASPAPGVSAFHAAAVDSAAGGVGMPSTASSRMQEHDLNCELDSTRLGQADGSLTNSRSHVDPTYCCCEQPAVQAAIHLVASSRSQQQLAAESVAAAAAAAAIGSSSPGELTGDALQVRVRHCHRQPATAGHEVQTDSAVHGCGQLDWSAAELCSGEAAASGSMDDAVAADALLSPASSPGGFQAGVSATEAAAGCGGQTAAIGEARLILHMLGHNSASAAATGGVDSSLSGTGTPAQQQHYRVGHGGGLSNTGLPQGSDFYHVPGRMSQDRCCCSCLQAQAAGQPLGVECTGCGLSNSSPATSAAVQSPMRAALSAEHTCVQQSRVRFQERLGAASTSSSSRAHRHVASAAHSMAAMVAAHVAGAASAATGAGSCSRLASHDIACQLRNAGTDCLQAGAGSVLEENCQKHAEPVLLPGQAHEAFGADKEPPSLPACGWDGLHVPDVGSTQDQLPAHQQVSRMTSVVGVPGLSVSITSGAAAEEWPVRTEQSSARGDVPWTVQGATHQVAAGAAVAVPAAPEQVTLLSLLNDDGFLHQLLSSLPGVTVSHPQVLRALGLLRAWLQQQ